MARRRARIRRLPTDAGLSITSLMDMMTIILVFLLTNYSANVLPVQPSDNFRLPLSTAQGDLRVTATIIVTREAVFVDGQRVLSLGPGTEPGVDLAVPDAEKQDGTVPAVYDPLVAEVAAMRQLPAGEDGEPAFRGEILMQLDRRTPFAVVRDLMKTAGAAGFGTFRFVVVADPGQ
ncbi:MAG: biopolymer transporter ExbD [Myxococcota bacterium]